MKKSPWLVLLVILAAVVAAALAYHALFGARTLPDPRALVPASAHVYVETSSLDEADSALADLSAALQVPLSTRSLLERLAAPGDPLAADPRAAGIDPARPLGFAFVLPLGVKPLEVAFLPVGDEKALAAALGAEPAALAEKAAALKSGFGAFHRGYLLVSSEEASINDLLSLPDKGVDLPEPLPGRIISVHLLPAFLRQADTYLASVGEGFQPMARFTLLIGRRIVSSLSSLHLDAAWQPAGARLSLRARLVPGSLLSGIAPAPPDRLPFLDKLPAGAIVAGARLDPAATRRAAETLLADLEPFLADSHLADVFRSSLDLSSAEAATSVVELRPLDPAGLSTLTLQSIVAGDEERFSAMSARFLREGMRLWEETLRSTGQAGSAITGRDLPGESHRGVAIRGFATETRMGFEIPAEADAETRRMMERMRVQRTEQRFAILPHPGGAGSAFLTAAGGDSALVRRAIDLFLDGGATADQDPGIRRAQAALSLRPALYAFIDPLSLAAPGSEPGGFIAIGAAERDGEWVLEAAWPREHAQGLPLRMMTGALSGFGSR